MRSFRLLFFLLFTVFSYSQELPKDDLIKYTPEELVQQQVDGYNSRDIEAFLEPYSDDFETFEFPDKLIGKGKEEVKKNYKELFEKYPDLHCEVVKRMVLGNKVIDQELITGIGEEPISVIAIYEINKGKITRFTFMN